MGRFLNPDNSSFQDVINSEIYVDKTGLLDYTNSVINTTSKSLFMSGWIESYVPVWLQ